jgi:hypothetical protein
VLTFTDLTAALVLLAASAAIAIAALAIARLARLDRVVAWLQHSRRPHPADRSSRTPEPLRRAA